MADLSSYAAIIVVGGVHAIKTDRHVHQYFAGEVSLKQKLTPENLEIRGQSYCDWWRREINGSLVYLIGGLSRIETCQAILKFVESANEENGEFRRLVATVHAGYQSDL